MHNKILNKYNFIKEFDQSHLDKQDKKTIIIFRNYNQQTNEELILTIKNYCKKKGNKFLISNNIKLAIKLNANGVYISSSNKNLNHKFINLKNNFKILGSAHNFKEIKIKELQRVEEIFLSPLFKRKNNTQLDIYRYLKLKKSTFMKDISLGGINKSNIKKLKLVNSFGFAAITYFKKKGL